MGLDRGGLRHRPDPAPDPDDFDHELVAADLPFGPVYIMQLATGYMNLALPSSLARMAINIRFFQRQVYAGGGRHLRRDRLVRGQRHPGGVLCSCCVLARRHLGQHEHPHVGLQKLLFVLIGLAVVNVLVTRWPRGRETPSPRGCTGDRPTSSGRWPFCAGQTSSPCCWRQTWPPSCCSQYRWACLRAA